METLHIPLQNEKVKVPNEKPKVSVGYKIAIVGEAPGETEELMLRPFVGPSGSLLNSLLSSAGITRSGCLLGNICQVRPERNEISQFIWDGSEIQDGLKNLRNDLTMFGPNIIILLGSTALKACLEPGKDKITDWRGSLFVSSNPQSPYYGFKCIPSLHPANVLRQWDGMPLLLFDLKRARKEADDPNLLLPERNFDIDLTCRETLDRLNAIVPGTKVSVDIEGGLSAWTMISVSTNENEAFCICFGRFSFDEELLILEALSRLLHNSSIPKVLQNCLYDNFVLSYGFRLPIRNVGEDTMLKGWEIYSELPKGLGVQASIWTRHPFFKVSHSAKARQERLSNDNAWKNYQRYCCADSATTLEISNQQGLVLKDRPLGHYRFNMDMLVPLLYMQLRGLRYDLTKAKSLLGETNAKVSEVRTRIDTWTQGYSIFGPKSTSPKKLAEFLYRRLGLPIQYKKEKGKLTTKETTDIEALLTLAKKTQHPLIYDLLEISKLQSDRESLETTCDPDGRVRCGYNIVGTETGRLTCYTSPTGSGGNLQTITKRFRVLYQADPGYDLFQCDLSGADGWTVAAHCRHLGDPTMFDDLIAGIKPAKVIALMYRYGVEIGQLGRSELLDRSREVDDSVAPYDWLYFASKRVYHGSNYGMGKITMSAQILKDSFKLTGIPVHVSAADCQKLQDLYLHGRYRGVRLWQRYVEAQIHSSGRITSASGHTRMLFGRRGSRDRTDHETLKQSLADEPQQNTTYATNLAMLRLWNDKQNRIDKKKLIIEPLHQVHDALIGQFPREKREWAIERITSYFNNRLVIGETEIVIPFEMGIGPSWGELERVKV